MLKATRAIRCEVVGMLALWLAGCAAGVAPPAAPAPDLILHHAKIVTVDKTFSIAQAIAIREGKIIAVGTDADILASRGPNTQVIAS